MNKNQWRGGWLKECWLYGYSSVPSVLKTPQSVRIDFLSVCWSCSCELVKEVGALLPALRSSQTHKCISLSLLLTPAFCSLTSHVSFHKVCRHQVLLHNPPPPAQPKQQQQQHHCINMHLPDKWSTLSMFTTQILSHPLAGSQSFDLSVCLCVSQPDAFSFRQITGSM